MSRKRRYISLLPAAVARCWVVLLRYGNAPRRMPLPQMGEHYLGWGPERSAADCKREDKSGPARPPAQPSRPHGAGEFLEGGGRARGSPDVACSDERRAHQSRQPETATQESPQACKGPALRGVLNPSHVPHPLGESGCDVWTLARIAGHSNISISQRYVHPSEDAVLNALSRLDGGSTSGLVLTSGQSPRPSKTEDEGA